MYLFQILVPINPSAQNRSDSKNVLAQIEHELTERFGGVNAYTQSPAKGLWKRSKAITRDRIIVVEVMSRNRPLQWWKKHLRKLENRLKQEKIAVPY